LLNGRHIKKRKPKKVFDPKKKGVKDLRKVHYERIFSFTESRVVLWMGEVARVRKEAGVKNCSRKTERQ
jgi:hypothetical protein